MDTISSQFQMNAVLLPFLFLFCKAVLVLTFGLSFIAKIRDIQSFKNAIVSFNLTPKNTQAFIAYSTLVLELMTVVSILWVSPPLGFSVSIFSLFVFTLAISIAILRREKVSCNCFGSNSETISSLHIVRNLCLLAVSIVALVISTRLSMHVTFVSLLPTSLGLLAIVMAIAFLALLLNLNAISSVIGHTQRILEATK
jgi:Methylamine utilisation protein MauE